MYNQQVLHLIEMIKSGYAIAGMRILLQVQSLSAYVLPIYLLYLRNIRTNLQNFELSQMCLLSRLF